MNVGISFVKTITYQLRLFTLIMKVETSKRYLSVSIKKMQFTFEQIDTQWSSNPAPHPIFLVEGLRGFVGILHDDIQSFNQATAGHDDLHNLQQNAECWSFQLNIFAEAIQIH